MNIVMVTNTYLPHVGGVAKSVSSFTEEYRKMGHRVLVVCPEFPDASEEEKDVIRLAAIQNFSGGDFSVVLPVPAFLNSRLSEFEPDICHSHHPYLLGNTAVRIADDFNIPLIFTHHTMYEKYTHYVPADSEKLKSFVIQLATNYANMCDYVVAPSSSVREVIRERGVKTPIQVIPTGVQLDKYKKGNGKSFREEYNIGRDKFVLGHVGRLAPEKNLSFLANAAACYMEQDEEACFLVVGGGPSEADIRNIFKEKNMEDRLYMTGKLSGQELIDSYHAMDMFIFASLTETQGMVLAEATAAGLPLVAIDAPGAREVVRDRENGRLIDEEDLEEFCNAIKWVGKEMRDNPEPVKQAVHKTAHDFSLNNCAQNALELYKKTMKKGRLGIIEEHRTIWDELLQDIRTEWNLLSSATDALKTAISEPPHSEEQK